MTKIYLFLFSFFLLAYTPIYTQTINYGDPLKMPLLLSGNFGELRGNHFHSGVDFKTQGSVNHLVYSIEEGHVSRINISPAGYGLALYVDHPNGQTSVYAHLNSYSKEIADYLKEKQYEAESFRLDVTVPAGVLPVKKGQIIGKSGNTGSSGGPHVHFEIRDTKTEYALDPLEHYKSKIKDTTKPQLRAIAVYPLGGSVNGKNTPYRENINMLKSGAYNVLKTPKAWGRVGVAVCALDKMDGTNNLYGVRDVKLFCDEKLIFHSDLSFIDFDNTRMLNTLVDYNFWKGSKRFYMKSFIESGNELKIYKHLENDGYIDVNEERLYNLRYELMDLYGNKTTYKFNLQGARAEDVVAEPCSLVMRWNEDNSFVTENFSLSIPKGNLYTDVNFVYHEGQKSQDLLSNTYTLHNEFVPIHSRATINLVITDDSIPYSKEQLGIVTIDKKGAKNWVGGTNKGTHIEANIRELGNTYGIYYDNTKPTVTEVAKDTWIAKKRIIIRATDDLSGLQTCRGEIDGAFVLFENDTKSPNYTYYFDDSRLEKGKDHTLVFKATDACGNQTEYTYMFKY